MGRIYDKVMNAELDYYYDIDLGEYAERYQEIRDKYNPIMQKTDSGKSYLEGSFGRNLPIPKISEDQIKEEIMMQFIKLMSNAKFTNC